MKNSKGFTLVELAVSIILISIVLIFIVQLYTRVRSTQKNRRIDTEYELTRDIIVNAVMSDLSEEDYTSISHTNNSVTINYSLIGRKKLSVEKNEDNYYIKYICDDSNGCLGSENIYLKLPEDAIMDSYNLIHYNEINLNLIEIKIPLESEYGNNYKINIYITKSDWS